MKLNCTQCGADLKYKEGEKFLNCSFCDASLYIEKSKIVFHYWINPTLDMPGAHKNLRRWMAGNDTIEGLEKKSKTKKQEFFFFPIWLFKLNRGGREEIMVEPAIPISVSEIRFIDIPAGMLKFYDPAKIENPDAFQEVEVSYDAATRWLEDREINKEMITEVFLVHVPVYRFTYHYGEYEYSAVVEAATGKIFANVYPAKNELPFTLITLGTALIFMMEGLLCPTILIRFIVMSLTAAPLGYLAYYIAKKY